MNTKKLIHIPLLMGIICSFSINLAHAEEKSDLEKALADVYKKGYKAGFVAGQNSLGGGSTGPVVGGQVIGFFQPGSGGSTSGYEVPWAYLIDNATKELSFAENNKLTFIQSNLQEKNVAEKIIGKFNVNKSKTGTIVIENVLVDDFNKLDAIIKNTDNSRIWIAPSMK